MKAHRAAVARGLVAGSLLAVTALLGAAAGAQQGKGQQGKGPPNALQGFSTNRDKPVRIRAASLEVRDKDKVATFNGDVHVVQGDTDMRCKTLIVFYEEDPNKPSVPAQAAAPGQPPQQIRRMEAKGGVIVKQKDQVATGDTGEYDVRNNTITLIGNVVVTRGPDVLRGKRLVVNLTTGVSNVESGGPERVEMLVNPSSRPDAKPGPGQSSRPAGRN